MGRQKLSKGTYRSCWGWQHHLCGGGAGCAHFPARVPIARVSELICTLMLSVIEAQPARHSSCCQNGASASTVFQQLSWQNPFTHLHVVGGGGAACVGSAWQDRLVAAHALLATVRRQHPVAKCRRNDRDQRLKEPGSQPPCCWPRPSCEARSS